MYYNVLYITYIYIYIYIYIIFFLHGTRTVALAVQGIYREIYRELSKMYQRIGVVTLALPR